VGFGERVLRRRDLGIATVRKEGDRFGFDLWGGGAKR
jgi:hypothetical protein